MTVSTIGSTGSTAAPIAPPTTASAAGAATAAPAASGASFGATLMQQAGQQERAAAARDMLAAVPPPVALSWRGAAGAGAPDAGIDALFRALKDGSFKPEPAYETGNGIIATTLRATKVFDSADQFWAGVRGIIGAPVDQLEAAVRAADGSAAAAPATTQVSAPVTTPPTVAPTIGTGSIATGGSTTSPVTSSVTTHAAPHTTAPAAPASAPATHAPAPAQPMPLISSTEQAYRLLGGALPPAQIGWWRSALDYLLGVASRDGAAAGASPK